MIERLATGVEHAIDSLLASPSQSTLRLRDLADLLKRLLDEQGLPGVVGGSSGELAVPGDGIGASWSGTTGA